MRYIIDTKDEQGIIGMQIKKWENEKKLDIIEKADPVIELKTHLEKIARALDVLNKAGYNSEIMEIFLVRKTGLGMNKIQAVLKGQKEFFKQIGVKL
jgi:antitoxin component HigA of HigAB toxin-antitoxin module